MSNTQPQRMKYTYVTAWSVIGGINMPGDLATMELVTGDGSTCVLTKTPDEHLMKIDRGTAAANLLLSVIFRSAQSDSLDERLEVQLAKIREERKHKMGTFPVLIFTGTGDAEVTVKSNANRHDDFMITFDGVDKGPIRKRHQHEIHAIKGALGLETSSRVRYKQMTSGIYFTNEESLTVYSLTFNMSADMVVSSVLGADALARLTDRFSRLRLDREMQSVLRLYAEMNDQDREPLRVFLAGFFALEILIHKAFSTYEEEVLAQLHNGRQAFFSTKFVERLRETMSGKYRLADKFLLVSAALFPDMDAAAAEGEFVRFMMLKKQRDEISHGNEFSEDRLPVNELNDLLTKYISAHALTPRV